MRIVNLIPEWRRDHLANALTPSSAPSDASIFRTIERQRVPAGEQMHSPADLDKLISYCDDPSLHSDLRSSTAIQVQLGWQAPEVLALFASAEPGPPSEVIIDEQHDAIVLFVDRAHGDDLIASLVAAIAHRARLVRLIGTGSLRMPTAWNRWEAASEVPLAEWIYSAGLGVHAVAERFPGWSPNRWLRVSRGEYRKLRTRERAAMDQLRAEMNGRSVGLLIKWLNDEAPPALRRSSTGRTLPRGIGRYLGWRMLRDRVARVGVMAAAGMGAAIREK